MKATVELQDLKELADKLGLKLRLDSPRLKGLWSDVKLTERDIQQAKKAVFRTT